MKVKRIYLVRHGALDRRYDKRFIGRTNVPLSSKGRRQARKLAKFFEEKELSVLSSPLRRARAMARLIAPKAPIKDLPDLREMDFGRWEGLNFGEIQRRDPKLVKKWARFAPDFRFPGGESLRSFQQRLNRLEKNLCGIKTDTLLVSHGGVIRSLICLWQGKPLRRYPEIQVKQGSVSVVTIRNARTKVATVGREI